MSLRRRIALLATATLVALVGWLVVATPASAHNVLRSTSPADGSTVDAVPDQVVLTFDEPALAMGTGLAITGPDGPVQTGSARLVDNTVAQSIGPAAPAGTYRVDWRVTSADGHPISGTFSFTASRPGGGSAAPSAPAGGTSSPGSTQPGPQQGVPAWLWPVVGAMLLLSALSSMAIARRRRRR